MRDGKEERTGREEGRYYASQKRRQEENVQYDKTHSPIISSRIKAVKNILRKMRRHAFGDKSDHRHVDLSDCHHYSFLYTL